MKVIAFSRCAQSGIHLHACHSAHCFFIPDENIVLASEHAGTFSFARYSVHDSEDILKEAQAVAAGTLMESEGVIYSEVTPFEYEDAKIRELIADARQERDVEKRVKQGIELLLLEVRKKDLPVEMLDPALLDAPTRQRLELIVKEVVTLDHSRASWYETLGSAQAKETLNHACEKHIREELEKVRTGKLHYTGGCFENSIKEAQALGLVDVAHDFAELTIKQAHPQDFQEKILAAEVLEKPKVVHKLRKERVLDAMLQPFPSSNSQHYFTEIQKHAKDLSDEEVRDIAHGAFQKMRGRYFRNFSSYNEYTLTAALLAKKYLGRAEVEEAGEAYVRAASKNKIYSNIWERKGRVIAELGLSAAVVRPLMIKMFEATLTYKLEQALEIVQSAHLQDEELRKPVNAAYHEQLQHGDFESAYSLREAYNVLIEKPRIAKEDLKMLRDISTHIHVRNMEEMHQQGTYSGI